MNRRLFINQAAGVITLPLLPSWISNTKSPTSEVSVGFIGPEDRSLVAALTDLPGLTIACSGSASNQIVEHVLRRSDIDAVFITASGTEGIRLAAEACTAGKHAYIVAPGWYSPQAGERLLASARNHKRIVWIGAAHRSYPALQQAVKAVREGVIGNLYRANAWAYSNQFGEKYMPDLPELDCCRWFLGVDYPSHVEAFGNSINNATIPDAKAAQFTFGEKVITWQYSPYISLSQEVINKRGFTIYGDKGVLSARDGDPSFRLTDLSGKSIPQPWVSEPVILSNDQLTRHHIAAFLRTILGAEAPAVRSIEVHKSTLLTHLSNVAWQVKEPLYTDAKTGGILANETATAFWNSLDTSPAQALC